MTKGCRFHLPAFAGSLFAPPLQPRRDKQSKTKIFIDTDLVGNVINIAWEPSKYPKNIIRPHKNLDGAGLSFEDAVRFGLEVARSNTTHHYS